MKTRLIHLIYLSDLHATRFLLALAEICWSASLAWPGDTFGRPTYTMMSRLASEEAWAVVFGITGIIQFALLYTGRYHSRAAVAFAGWNSVLWCYVVAAMYLSVYPPPAAISGELALAWGAMWVFARSGRIYERINKEG